MADVQARGLRFHVQRLGEGPPTVVFLHGLVMDNLSSWYFTVANAAGRHAEAIVYDLRGHGRSERPPTGYSVAEMVADLNDLLDALGISHPVHLVGNSFGGLLALAFGAAHPERVAGVVLVDAHLSHSGWGAEMAATLRLEGSERDQRIADSFQHWLGRHSGRKRNRLADNAKALVYGTTLVADLEASAPLSDDDLRRITAPVLALYGETSDLRDAADRLRSVLPRCELRVLAGCSHSVIWEATDAVRAAVLEHLGVSGAAA